MISYEFKYKDEVGNEYEMKNTVEINYDFGDSEILSLARALNLFLRQCGYFYNKDMVFLESITEEEFEKLADFLCEIREKENEK